MTTKSMIQLSLKDGKIAQVTTIEVLEDIVDGTFLFGPTSGFLWLSPATSLCLAESYAKQAYDSLLPIGVLKVAKP